jgi:hypothetical protein
MRNEMFGEGKYLIEGEGDERLLIHCCYCNPSSDIVSRREMEELKVMFKIKKISSGCCAACYKIQMEIIDNLNDE